VEEAEEGEISEPVSKESSSVESNGSKVEGVEKEKEAVAAAA